MDFGTGFAGFYEFSISDRICRVLKSLLLGLFSGILGKLNYCVILGVYIEWPHFASF